MLELAVLKNSSEYAIYLKSIAESEDGLYEMFASQVFALGTINQVKNENIRLALYFFISAPIIRIIDYHVYGIFKSFTIFIVEG